MLRFVTTGGEGVATSKIQSNLLKRTPKIQRLSGRLREVVIYKNQTPGTYSKKRSRIGGRVWEVVAHGGSTVSKGYQPEARGYVIYSPQATPKGNARGE